MLSNVTNQSNFNNKGLGSLNITYAFNPHSKYVFVSDNLLCLHCGKNGHSKEECTAWRKSHERLSKYTERKGFQKRDLVPQNNSQPKVFQRKDLILLKNPLSKRI